MEIMKHIAVNMSHKKINMYIYFLTPLALLLFFIYNSDLTDTINKLNKADGYTYRVLYYMPSVIMIILIYIWFYFSQILYKNIKKLNGIFGNNRKYNIVYKSLKKQMNQFKLYKNVTGSIFKILYTIFWIITWSLYIFSIHSLHLIPDDVAGYMFVIFIFFIILLNFSSYYSCVVLVFFFKKVANISDLRYNKYRPCETVGFQRLLQTSNTAYLFFLLDSFSCMLIQFMLMCRYKMECDLYNKVPDDFRILFFLTLMALMLGLLSFCIITFFLKFYLRRLYNNWKEKALSSFQEKLYNAENKKNEDKVEKILVKIDMVYRDKKEIHETNIITSIVSISTILGNIIGLIYNITLLLS